MSEHDGGYRESPLRRPSGPPRGQDWFDDPDPYPGEEPEGDLYSGQGYQQSGYREDASRPPYDPAYQAPPPRYEDDYYRYRDRQPPPPVPPQARPRPVERSFGSALLLTILGTLLPGLGLMAAGRRRLGGTILAVTLGLLCILGWFAVFRWRELLHLGVDADALAIIGPAALVVGLAWVTLIVGSYRSLRPWRISPLVRMIGSLLVTVLALTVLFPMAKVSHLATVQQDLLATVFRSADEVRSETRPKNVTAENPWGGQDRVNVLLLGGDAGEGRIGTRTDTVIVASIDTKTGNAVLLSLPRNLEQVPFPPDSKLAEAYPNGTFDPGRPFESSSEELEYMLTAMYENVPEQHPGLIKSDNPGADVLKMAVGEALGLEVHYYVLVNLKGFSEIIDALGGITVNVNSRVAIGGDTSAGRPPKDWIEPGPNKHLDGYKALWFARGRYGSNDYERMNRQRCTMNAIIKQANPQQVLQRYEAIARETKEIVQTDIPRDLLGPFVDLSLQVKDAQLESVVFDRDLIVPWDPDYDKIRAKVRQTIDKSMEPPGSKASGKPEATGSPRSEADGGGDSGSEDSGSTKSEGGDEAGAGKKESAGAKGSLEQNCAYQPEE